MPNTPRKALRRLLPVLPVLVALGIWAALAWGAPTVTILAPDETPTTVDLAEMDAENPTHYCIRTSRNGECHPALREVYPLNRMFRENGLDRRVEEVALDDQGAIVLDETQLDMVPPPGLYIDEQGAVRFVRHSTGPLDVQTTIEREMAVTEIRQRSDSSLALNVTAKATSDDGKTVSFQVAQSGGGIGQQYRYEWDFGDGSTEIGGKRIEHTYDEYGDYTVRVTLSTRYRGDDFKMQMDREKSVKVERPKQKEKEKDDPTGNTGTSTGTGTGSAGATTYDGSAGTGGSGSSVTPPPDTFDSIISDRQSIDGNTVEGALLTNVDVPLGGGGAGDAAVTQPLNFEVPEPGGEVPPAAWSGLGALALMGAGALLEAGRRPRLRLPRRLSALPRR